MRPAQSPSQDAAVRAVGGWGLMLQTQYLSMDANRLRSHLGLGANKGVSVLKKKKKREKRNNQSQGAVIEKSHT